MYHIPKHKKTIIIKFLEENTEENICDVGGGSGVLHKMVKVLITNEKKKLLHLTSSKLKPSGFQTTLLRK